ncbi:MAG: hypothetical protein IT305_23775 [Chloroflexi bacterium]|nr:hypothetical protein [Chloroflexota bacterium]
MAALLQQIGNDATDIAIKTSPSGDGIPGVIDSDPNPLDVGGQIEGQHDDGIQSWIIANSSDRVDAVMAWEIEAVRMPDWDIVDAACRSPSRQ